MSRIIKYICLASTCLLLSFSQAMAEQLSYNGILKSAVENSYDLKMVSLDIDISKADLKNARSDLFPILSSQLNTEYYDSLAQNASFATIGNTVLPPNSQYKDLAYLSLSYNLFDFGATGKKVFIAKKDIEQKKMMYDIQFKDLNLKLIELYTKTLIYNNEIKSKSKMLKLYQELFLAREKLFESGSSNKLLVMDEAVRIARTQDDIETAKTALKQVLNDLTSLTKQNYNIEELEVLNFDDENILPVNEIKPKLRGIVEEKDKFSFTPSATIEAKYYDAELQKKKAELDMYKKQRFPSFKLYSNYSFYGQNPDKYVKALDNVEKTSFSLGVTGSYTLFDGFKNKSSREKATLEMSKIQLEKEKKLNELKNKYEKSYTTYLSYINELSIKQDLLGRIREKLDAVERLSFNGLMPKTELLTIRADLLNQELDVQKNVINISSKIKELKILVGENT
jgi:outer membrane protein TolC